MPFSTLHYPSIGLSLLKPALQATGVECSVRYFFLDYADRVGIEAYNLITDPQCYQALVGEWIFAGVANEETNTEDSLAYFGDVLAQHYPELYTADRLLAVLGARHGAEGFVAWCAEQIGDEFDLVGFTTSFQQTAASVALARHIKRRLPQIHIVFGGANCRAEMGRTLLRCYPFLDAVCLDEGDRVFPEYLGHLMAEGSGHNLAGMAVRCDGVVMEPVAMSAPVTDLDALPYPDFSDFFEQHKKSRAGSITTPAVLVETSRGCWWGAKHHCVFCGINGMSMAFRSKSQDRAYEEIKQLAECYGSDFVNVDAILDQRSFAGHLSRLAADGPKITMYVEVKSNLHPEQIAILSRSGAKKIQPGIEALDTPLLTLMHKGCSMLQNVQTLKIAAECGVYVEWNLLHGFPGEKQQSYERSASLIPLLIHLQPPNAVGAARADRFSPYFERPKHFEIELEPLPAYRYVFPFDYSSVRGLAYHFLIRNDRAPEVAVSSMLAVARQWKDHHEISALTVATTADGCTVRDERWGRKACEYQLRGCAAAIYALTWRITSRLALCLALNGSFHEDEIDRELTVLVASGLLITEQDKYLALALRQPGYRRAPSWSEIRHSEIVPHMLGKLAV
jgi:ribosomal peptide maturation radical SAM protein 1